MIETIFFETSMPQFAYFINWLALTLLWLISIKIKDSSIIDIYWGFGFVLIAWACSYHNDINGLASTDTRELLLVMVSVWGFEINLLSCKKKLRTRRGLQIYKNEECLKERLEDCQLF